jgi:hypothetical protein
MSSLGLSCDYLPLSFLVIVLWLGEGDNYGNGSRNKGGKGRRREDKGKGRDGRKGGGRGRGRKENAGRSEKPGPVDFESAMDKYWSKVYFQRHQDKTTTRLRQHKDKHTKTEIRSRSKANDMNS